MERKKIFFVLFYLWLTKMKVFWALVLFSTAYRARNYLHKHWAQKKLSLYEVKFRFFFLLESEIILFQCPCCHTHSDVLPGSLCTALPRRFAWGLFADLLFLIWEYRAWNSDWKNYSPFLSDILTITELILITSIIQTLNIVQYLECLRCTKLHSHKVNIFISVTYCELNIFLSGLYAVLLGGDFSVHRMHTLHTAWQCKTILYCSWDLGGWTRWLQRTLPNQIILWVYTLNLPHFACFYSNSIIGCTPVWS